MTTFAFDTQRNYCQNDINEYLKRLEFLKSKFPNFASITKPDSEVRSQLEWAKLQNSDEAIPYDLKKGRFYVFFEMPERCKKYYDFYRIPYLNFMTPKIRFNTLPDCFMLESNLPIPEEFFINHIKLPGRTIIPEYADKTLILGQMWCDRTTIFEGDPKSVFDYNPKGDLFRPHPNAVKFQPEHAEKEELRAAELGLGLATQDKVYDVLASVKKVVGISSGALYEAKMLGTEVEFLDEKDYIARAKLIDKDTIDRAFWRKILGLL